MFDNHILSFEELEQKIKNTAAENPEIRLRTFGESEDKRPLYVMEIGEGGKAVFILGGVHGRESINPAVLVQIAQDTANLYKQQDTAASQLLKEYRLLFIPLLNPDGYVIAQEGFSAIRNDKLRKEAMDKKIRPSEWKGNGRGMDLNRNFPSVSYRSANEADYAGSEAESRALIRLIRENQNAGMLDFHSRGEVIYYYRNALGADYNKRQRRLAQYLADESGYYLGTAEDEFAGDGIGGNTVHFYSEYTKMPAITVETVPSAAQFPLPAYLQERVYGQIKNLPMVFLMGLKTTEAQA